MGKKVALFILGVALVLGVFMIYQYLAGPAVPGKKAVIKLINPPTTLPLYWEERDPNGVLLYVITAAQSPELLRDEAGNPLPGQFRIEKPLATFYHRSGRIIQISADLGRAVIDQGPKGAGGLPGIGGKGGGRLTLRGGELEGHVRMTVTAKPGAPAPGDAAGARANPLAGGFRVYCDDILELDGTQEVLTTKGVVHVRSDSLDFDGRGMQLIFNRKEERLDYLGIEQGDKILLRGVGAKALAFTDVSTRPAGGGNTLPARTATTLAGTTGKPSPPPATYRLTFGQDVKASVKTSTGESTLTGDRLYILFQAAGELFGDTRPAPANALAPAANVALPPGPVVPPLLQVPDVPEPIALARDNDVVVHWSGPMEIRPADDTDLQLASAHDVVVEALGTALQPVTVTDPRFSAQSGRLWYHQDEQRLVLEPRDFKKVLLGDPARGNVECAAVAIDLKANHAVLTGPGTLLARAGAGGSQTAVKWKTRMDLDLEPMTDAKDPAKKTLAIRRAVLDGVTVKAETFDLQADTLDVLIANILDKGKQVQALEHLLATGHVLVHSYRKGTANEQGGIQTPQRLEILTARPADSAVPVPAQLIAQGNVLAWRYAEKGKGLGAGDAGTPAVPATDSAARQKESIATSKLVASLVPKAKSATAPAADNGIAGLGQNFDVTRFIAGDGARVEIVPPVDPQSRTIVATATTIDGQPLAGTATLTAAAGADPVRVAIGGNSIEGRTIVLEQNPEKTVRMFKVAGEGVFHITLPPDKTRKTAAPMAVTWQNGMTYDDLKHLAVFTGKPVARVLPAPGAPDQSDQARLQCANTLTVQLKPAAPAAATGAAPAAFADGNLDLDWIQADGNVEAYGAQFGPDNKLLTSLLLKAPDSSAAKLGSLHYSKGDNAFVVDGPGTLTIENHRPDKPDVKVSAAGESGFRWQGSLKYDGKANTITFAREVEFVFLPTRHFSFSAALPGAATPPGPRQPDVLKLQHADQLVCLLTASANASGKTIEGPLAFGAAGNQEVSRVDASGRPWCIVGTYRMVNGAPAIEPTYIISGDTMSFDVPTNLAMMTGKVDDPAIVQRAGSAIFSGRRLKLDLTKDKKFFEGEDWQGNLSNFGG
jgi:hypothetical protein